MFAGGALESPASKTHEASEGQKCKHTETLHVLAQRLSSRLDVFFSADSYVRTRARKHILFC